MTAKNNLEIDGRLSRNPFAELLTEISQIKLSGSLRISENKQKIIVYIDDGEIVFAVSNSRKHRLFEVLLNQNMIAKEELTKITNFTNDLYLAKELVRLEKSTKDRVNSFFVYQIKEILKDAIYFDQGEWTFSSLARIKSGIRFEVEISDELFDFGKSREKEFILGRFKSFDEVFWRNQAKKTDSATFSPQEGFILSRINDNPISIEDIRVMCGLPKDEILQILYKLWLGGYIFRGRWNSAFSKDEISKMNSSNFTLSKSAISIEEEQKKVEDEKERLIEEEQLAKEAAADKAKEEKDKKAAAAADKAKEATITLEEYLIKVEQAATHYEIFDLKPNANVSEIKKSYFALAKNFHPDLFHKKVEDKLHARIQHAFTEIAHAYDTLKDEEAREVYDFKLRKVLEKFNVENADELSKITKEEVESTQQDSLASDSFDRGYDYLMNAQYEEALPHLGRAVHLEDDNARYHAFYGKALSFDKNKRHTAENELQTAIKIDPDNTVYRIMLAELFIEIGLKARAKGELTRLLKIAPNNKEAQSMLDSLADK